jgi:hypothetical protein
MDMVMSEQKKALEHRSGGGRAGPTRTLTLVMCNALCHVYQTGTESHLHLIATWILQTQIQGWLTLKEIKMQLVFQLS